MSYLSAGPGRHIFWRRRRGAFSVDLGDGIGFLCSLSRFPRMISRPDALAPGSHHNEDDFERALRPATLDEFVGQQQIKDNLRIFMTAALQRGETLDHVLLSGPPGLGKTTLAHIVAEEMGATIKTTSGPVLDRPANIAGLLTNLNEGDVLFIDEIHRLSRLSRNTFIPPWRIIVSTSS